LYILKERVFFTGGVSLREADGGSVRRSVPREYRRGERTPSHARGTGE